MQRNLIAKDREQTPLHHKIGTECREGARGLAVLPWEVAEVPEGYFSSQGVSPEKCGV